MVKKLCGAEFGIAKMRGYVCMRGRREDRRVGDVA
jgi:hypothetical protein